MESRCLIIGCGYVGLPLGIRLKSEGWEVTGVVRSRESQQQIQSQGLNAVAGDIGDLSFLSSLGTDFSHVIYCPSSGGRGLEGYQHVHRDALGLVLEQHAHSTRFFYTSSTSVYGQQEGEWLNETSPVQPEAATAQVLVEAEKRVCEAGGTVLRLGGIYGPGRGVLLTRLDDGRAMIPRLDPKWLNLIHLDDIISAILHGLSGRLDSAQVFNVIDDQPSSYREIYSWLCQRLGRDLPPVGDPEYLGKRGSSNKRVSNGKLKKTGWSPSHPSFREGYSTMMEP